MEKRVHDIFSRNITFSGMWREERGNSGNEGERNRDNRSCFGASEHQSTPLEELKDSYDVIIVGAGGGGMSAAIEAKDKGLNPVILKKCQ